MRITNYIPDYFYFENIADKLKPHYPSMLYKFNDNFELKSVSFKSLIDNNFYRVTYNYDDKNRIISERLVTLSGHPILNIKPHCAVCQYIYSYKLCSSYTTDMYDINDETITVRSNSNIAISKTHGLRLVDKIDGKSFYKQFSIRPGLLKIKIDFDENGRLVKTKYKYGFSDRIISKTVIDIDGNEIVYRL